MTLRIRFEAKYQTIPEAGCWIWTAAVNEHGYGVIGTGGHKGTGLAHRVSWQIHKGPIPDGLNVLHKCDTPCCVNPEHLFLGSQKDNVADMFAKGRNPFTGGETHGLAKLTAEDVRLIRSATGTHRDIARRFGVDHAQITRIKSRKLWASVA